MDSISGSIAGTDLSSKREPAFDTKGIELPSKSAVDDRRRVELGYDSSDVPGTVTLAEAQSMMGFLIEEIYSGGKVNLSTDVASNVLAVKRLELLTFFGFCLQFESAVVLGLCN